MSSKKNTFSDPFAEVDTQPVTVAGQEVSKIAVRVKDDSGDYVTQAILGKDYNLLKNSYAADATADIFSRSGMQFKELKTIWNGKSFVAYHHSVNPIHQIGEADNSIPLNLGCMMYNSYDGSRMFGMELFLLNPFCANQYHSRNAFGFFQVRHTGTNGDRVIEIDDAVSELSIGVQRAISVAPHIQQMRKQPLTLEHITTAKQKTVIPQSKWGDVIDQLQKEEGTVFGLFQALTFVASHKLAGLSSIGVSNSIGDCFLTDNRLDK